MRGEPSNDSPSQLAALPPTEKLPGGASLRTPVKFTGLLLASSLKGGGTWRMPSGWGAPMRPQDQEHKRETMCWQRSVCFLFLQAHTGAAWFQGPSKRLTVTFNLKPHGDTFSFLGRWLLLCGLRLQLCEKCHSGSRTAAYFERFVEGGWHIDLRGKGRSSCAGEIGKWMQSCLKGLHFSHKHPKRKYFVCPTTRAKREKC